MLCNYGKLLFLKVEFAVSHHLLIISIKYEAQFLDSWEMRLKHRRPRSSHERNRNPSHTVELRKYAELLNILTVVVVPFRRVL